ncbi:chromodomain-helicase-DNA-binding protein 7 [Striga asiatica]|uniref:Chromodomain-helicase-DNA-binding protein 7 n=1 Tax=Striga asiatica TaxID=4170 RepID=A0A5A7R748_STRAF|nr:chromodomain-helicase-DNA-binding protein 7 [Striga asiatica]
MLDVESRQIEPKDNIIQIYSGFMTKVAQFEELMSSGSTLLGGFQQALGFLGRPSISKTSPLVEHIVEAHGSRRILSYVESGCVNSHDSVQNVSKLHKCHIGLKDHINRSKIVINELEGLLDDAASVMQTCGKKEDEDLSYDSDILITLSDREKFTRREVADYAAMMAFVYSMVKQDYAMQFRIVSSLSYKSSSSGELETYCQMWALRPFVDDDVMQQAWDLVS